jgi:hypothetical protein
MRFTTIISTIRFALLFSCLAGSILHAQDTGNDYEDLYEQIRILAWSSGYNDVTPPEKQIKTLRLRDYKKAVAAYFWGLPLVEMHRSQKAVLGKYHLQPNDLYTPYDRNFGTSVVSPNLDVLNATGFIGFDDDHSAFVLTVPDTQYQPDTADSRGTFNVIQLLDAYTNVVESFGTRTDGSNSGGNFLIYGPDYDTTLPLPDGIIQQVGVETNQAWLIGRMAVDAYAENKLLGHPKSEYQEKIDPNSVVDLTLTRGREHTYKYGLTPLESFEQGDITATEKDPYPYTDPRGPEPLWDDMALVNFPMFGDYVTDDNGSTQHWTPHDILTYLGKSIAPDSMLDYTPPPPPGDPTPDPPPPPYANRTIFKEFESIGLTVGQYHPPPVTLGNVNDGVYAAAEFMGYLAKNLNKIPTDPSNPYADSPWTVQTDLGSYDTDPGGWINAAVVAAVGLGANWPDDGIYPVTDVDGDGNTLNGKKDYSLTFPAGELPPVIEDDSKNPLGFWSLTIYHEDGYIFQDPDPTKAPTNPFYDEKAPTNPFYDDQVHSLGSMQLDNLHGEDLDTTEVTFYLQNDQPTNDDHLPYWLPVPEGDFQVMMRVYYPDKDQFDAPLDSPSHYPLPDVVKTIPEPTTLLLALLALTAAPLRVRHGFMFGGSELPKPKFSRTNPAGDTYHKSHRTPNLAHKGDGLKRHLSLLVVVVVLVGAGQVKGGNTVGCDRITKQRQPRITPSRKSSYSRGNRGTAISIKPPRTQEKQGRILP